LFVPSSVVPTISALSVTKKSANATVQSWNDFIKGYSYATLAATAAGAYGSTITTYQFQVRKGTSIIYSYSQSTNSKNTSVLNAAGSDYTFVCTVTDSRGRTATYTTAAYTVYDYVTPSISATDVQRCLSNGTVDLVSGTYIKAKGTFNFSSCNGHNTATKKIEYRQLGSYTWTVVQSSPANFRRRCY